MRERAELFGGTFELSSASGVGTSIKVTIPLKGEPDNGT
jgi:signal transduction histidine kinase